VAARREDVAARVRDALARTPTSRTELAERLGVSLATLSRWASGVSSPSPDRWSLIEEMLDVELVGRAPDDSELSRLRREVEALGEQVQEQARQLGELMGVVLDLRAARGAAGSVP
jgi:ribosome-binding protein aMBF1 (putative translation factor)